MIPFRLPELLAALASGQTICIAEGEKKVDRIRDWGFPATCCAEGAKKWRAEHTTFMHGADIVLLPDNDPAGREHVELIAESLAPIACRLRILELHNQPEKGDVVDWHAAGGRAEEFARLVAAAPNMSASKRRTQPLCGLTPPEPFPSTRGRPRYAARTRPSDVVRCRSDARSSPRIDVVRVSTVNIMPTGQMETKSAGSGVCRIGRAQAAWRSGFRPRSSGKATPPAKVAPGTTRCDASWEAQAKAIEKQFKDPGAAGSEAHQKELEKLGLAPEKPLDPLIMSSEFTFEGLVRCLNLGQPLYGIIGSEGGQFIGGHGMTEESKLRTITGLSAAWDGEPIKQCVRPNRDSLRPAHRHMVLADRRRCSWR